VAESRAPRDGAYLDWIGTYDPMKDPPAFTLKTDRANEWLGKGAQPSDAVKRILDWNELLAAQPVSEEETAPTASDPVAGPPEDGSQDGPVEEAEAGPDDADASSNEEA
jgi:small subunit ribosomal protein S16